MAAAMYAEYSKLSTLDLRELFRGRISDIDDYSRKELLALLKKACKDRAAVERNVKYQAIQKKIKELQEELDDYEKPNDQGFEADDDDEIQRINTPKINPRPDNIDTQQSPTSTNVAVLHKASENDRPASHGT